MQVAQFLDQQQVCFETLTHPPAFSAQQRAKYLHVTGRQVAKCVLLLSPAGAILAILPATHHIDTTRLEQELNTPVRLATDEEVAHIFSDCEWGAIPPFGTMYGIRTILEDSLNSEDLLVFKANTHVEAVRLRCADFEKLERPLRLRFAL